MRKKDIILSVIIIFILLYAVSNIGAINNFLSTSTDKSMEFDDTKIVVPENWTLTSETNSTLEHKTNHSITNNYVVWDIFQNWVEDSISEKSHNKLNEMENGNYQVINSSEITLANQKVYKEYFYNPSRDSDQEWDSYGVTYVFKKEDTNYAIQIHYFTEHDLNNQSFTKELDDRVEDFIDNMHNMRYDGFISIIFHINDKINSIIKG